MNLQPVASFVLERSLPAETRGSQCDQRGSALPSATTNEQSLSVRQQAKYRPNRKLDVVFPILSIVGKRHTDGQRIPERHSRRFLGGQIYHCSDLMLAEEFQRTGIAGSSNE